MKIKSLYKNLLKEVRVRKYKRRTFMITDIQLDDLTREYIPRRLSYLNQETKGETTESLIVKGPIQ